MTVTIPFTFVGGTVISSSQVNANFAALANAFNTGVRTPLVAPTTFYLSPTGSDTGPATNPAQPAATVGYVLGLLRSIYDMNNQVVTISLANGTYTENVNLAGTLPGQFRPGNLIIQGNVGSPASVIFSGSPAFLVHDGAGVQVQGMRVTSPGNDCFTVAAFGTLLWQAIDFGSAVLNHVDVIRNGFAVPIGDYSISGGATNHWTVDTSTLLVQTTASPPTPPVPGFPTITLSGTPSFSGAFANVLDCSVAKVRATFAGSGATGVRYAVATNSVIQTGGAGANYLPGNSAGSAATGGQYL